MVSFSHLPEKVVEEIMSRLPAESLLHFKHVNKPWYFIVSALMNDMTFVAKHIRNTINKSSTSLVFEHYSCLKPSGGGDNKDGNDDLDDDDDDDDYDDDDDLIDETIFSLLSLSNDDGDKNRLRCLPEELNLPPLAKGGIEHCGLWEVICHCDA